MLKIDQLLQFYPPGQTQFKRNILREYLQYKILEIIFNSGYSEKLSFIGGTCLKIVCGTNRFSEDLDFDNFDLSFSEFKDLSELIKKNLENEGYLVEIKNINKAAYRCYIRIPNLLYNNKLSGYFEEKILIQIDTENQKFSYKSKIFLLNKFDVFTQIFYSPEDILLSQKIWAILNRKVPKGRDFYDTVFLFGLCEPNYDYLKIKAGISGRKMLKEKILERINKLKFETLAKDAEPFLINRSETGRITHFAEFIKGL